MLALTETSLEAPADSVRSLDSATAQPLRSKDPVASRLEAVLRAGHFAVTAEIAPPDCADPAEVYKRASVFDGWVDAINATDGSGANVHLSSMAICALMHRAGYTMVMQVSCRDRNRIAIQGDVLGGAALGIGNMLCLTGDGVAAGDHPDAKPVFDLGSVALLNAVRQMRDHRQYLSGRQLSGGPDVFLGAAANPFVPPQGLRPQMLLSKIAAGAQFFQTQYCFNIGVLTTFMRQYCDLGLAEQASLLVGVGPLASAKAARWIRARVPGVDIPDAIISRLEKAAKPAEEGRRICIEIMQQAREIAGVSGIHIMAPRQERFIGEMVAASGVLGTRRPALASPTLRGEK